STRTTPLPLHDALPISRPSQPAMDEQAAAPESAAVERSLEGVAALNKPLEDAWVELPEAPEKPARPRRARGRGRQRAAESAAERSEEHTSELQSRFDLV